MVPLFVDEFVGVTEDSTVAVSCDRVRDLVKDSCVDEVTDLLFHSPDADSEDS